jgi:hypothetical protein
LDRNTLPYKGWFQPYSVSSSDIRSCGPKLIFFARHGSALLG